MGRQSKNIGKPRESKSFNPGPANVPDEDPYEVAMRNPETPKRIPTVEGEE